jgi:hypothetical protein
MDQPFDRPLVIGYIGFDVPVLDNGRLGDPVLTANRLGLGKPQGSPIAAPSGAFRSRELNELDATLTAITKRADADSVMLDAAEKAGCGDEYKAAIATPLAPRFAFTKAVVEKDIPAIKQLVAARGAFDRAVKEDQAKAEQAKKKPAGNVSAPAPGA